MKANEQTIQQVERALQKIAAKYPAQSESMPLTDIYLQAKPESGELLAFNDDGEELNRCVIEQWIDNKEEHFYDDVQPVLRQCIMRLKHNMENMGILKPYSFVLVDDEKETVAELYLVDDDTLLLSGELMEGLDKELNDFLAHLLKD